LLVVCKFNGGRDDVGLAGAFCDDVHDGSAGVPELCGLVASGVIAALPEAVLGLVGLLSPTENPGRAIRLVAYRYSSL
jgi:hypothetical protein